MFAEELFAKMVMYEQILEGNPTGWRGATPLWTDSDQTPWRERTPRW